MIAVTAEEMRKIEEKAVREKQVTLEALMERAGQELAKEVLKEKPGKVVVVSGPGNNGGDGLVAARHLAAKGIETEVFLIAGRKSSSLLKKKLSELKKQRVKLITTIDELSLALKEKPIVIDAVFGFGFHGKAEGLFAQAIELINRSEATVYSADVPSGVNASSGQVAGPACRAKVTVTFSLPKLGLYLFPGSEFAGEVRVKKVVPPPFLKEADGVEVLTGDKMKKLLPMRSKEANKWSVGSVLVVAGSAGMEGAAILAVRGAERTGAGIVKLVSAASLAPIYKANLIESLFLPLPENLNIEEKMKLIEKESLRYKVIAIGPGLKESPDTAELVKKVFKLGKPVVADATALAYYPELAVEDLKAPVILTPHEGEFARLSGFSVAEIKENRLKTATDYINQTGRNNLILVLKGYRSLIVSLRRKALNLTGNPGLASAGTGDVLTGVIAALLAQGVDAFEAASLGVYLHGLAADLAVKDLGELSLTATDLVDYLPKAILKTAS